MQEEKRIVVLNEEVYEVSEGTYSIITQANRKMSNVMGDNFQDRHAKNCERVRKYGKILFRADLILRDD